MSLTAKFVDSVKPTPGKRVEYADDDVGGLSLRVTAGGAKSWALRYRNLSGRQRRLTLGGYPALSLKDARDAALRALGSVASERDPAQEKKARKLKERWGRTEKPQTLSDLWKIYERDVLGRKRAKTKAFQTWLWEKHIEPRLGAHELATLDRATIRAALKGIGESAPTTANRAQALIRHMLNVAVAEEYIAATPLAQMSALYDERSRERTLSDAEIKALWKAIGAAPAREDIAVGARMAAALKLVLVTLARPGDVAGLNASEIDVSARAWIIPGDRFKNGRPHTVPLSPLAWGLLREAFGAPPNKWKGPAFPNARKPTQPMERASLTRAMKRITTDAKMARCTPHDLRRTGATYLASERIGVAPHVVSAVLGHTQEGPAVSQVYNRHRYDKEKRAALEAWGVLLREIIGGTARASNITRLPTRRRHD